MKIKKLYEDAIIPTRGSDQAAGLDLYAHIYEPVWIPPHETRKIGAGIAVQIPEGYFGGIYSRSGLSTKLGLAVINGVGVIDSDYRGEVGIPLHNYTDIPARIRPDERIAQLVIQPYSAAVLEIVDDLDDTERGAGGFGSTGR